MSDTNENRRPPVNDWATDWDYLDPRWQNNPYPIWDELRQSCPIAHTQRFTGAYLPTRYEDVKAIAYDTERFSSRRVVLRDFRMDPPIVAPPITIDPPSHKAFKQILLPFFTLDQVARYEGQSRRICTELIDSFIADGHCDAATQYSRHVPVRVIATMLGVPETDGDLFIQWIHESLELGVTDTAIAKKANDAIAAYFAARVAERKEQPRDDLITKIMHARLNGEQISDRLAIGMMHLLMIAGIDTTWSAIGAALWHLGQNPEDARRLRTEPNLIPAAIEELLRAYSPVTTAREVMKDGEVGGCPVKGGKMLFLSFPAANRDPAKFPDADKVVIDRKENPHAAFGLGIHRCLGANLARMEMAVAIEEWLKRIPAFRLDISEPVRWSDGTVRGPRTLPMIFDRAQ